MRTPLRIRSYHVKKSAKGTILLRKDTFYSRRRVEKVEKTKAENKTIEREAR